MYVASEESNIPKIKDSMYEHEDSHEVGSHVLERCFAHGAYEQHEGL